MDLVYVFFRVLVKYLDFLLEILLWPNYSGSSTEMQNYNKKQ